MEATLDITYFPDHVRTSIYAHSRSNSVESISTIDSTNSFSANDKAEGLPHRRRHSYDEMDALAKETMGLPIFISPSTGATVSSGSQQATSTSRSTSQSTSSEEPLISGKRISQVLDFALTSLESIIVTSEKLIVKSAGLLLNDSDEEEEEEMVRRDTDLESGRRQSIGNAMRDKDGWVEGWLD